MVRPIFDPAETSAVSFVPSAITQQPLNPCLLMFTAASYPLICPGRTSTTERAPEMSVMTECTPTSSYLATIRSPGFGRYAGETRPSEVESPMCATARHDVRSVPPAAVPAGAGLVLELAPSVCGACCPTTVLVTGSCSEPCDATELTWDPAAVPTAPDSPMTATASTPVAPAPAASRPGVTRPRPPRPAARNRAHARPIAPCRIGSSMSCHESAASRMDAAI